MQINPWDIWWAEVEYEGHEGSKRRPILVISPGEVYILAYKITSHEARNQWGEYEIIEWQSAGLSRASTIRLTQPVQLETGSLKKKIGQLTPRDIEAVKTLIG